MKALIIAADDFEDLEVFYPYFRLKEAGFEVDIASFKENMIKGKTGYSIKATSEFSRVEPGNYDLLILPGGKAPEKIRLDVDALRIARDFMDKGKPVGAICHGAQVLISADRLKGRKATCYKGMRDDLSFAGAEYQDKPVIVDGNLVTSRHPHDLPYFMAELLRLLE